MAAAAHDTDLTERQQGATARQHRITHKNSATRLRADLALIKADINRHRRKGVQVRQEEAVVNNYYVLIGAELNPVKSEKTTLRTPPVMCGAQPQSHIQLVPAPKPKFDGDQRPPFKKRFMKAGFACVSTDSVLGPPFRVAIACTCPDWEYRSGFSSMASAPVPSRVKTSSLEHAAVGCKHMMIANTELLQTEAVTFGASNAASIAKDAFLAQPGPAAHVNNATAYATNVLSL